MLKRSMIRLNLRMIILAMLVVCIIGVGGERGGWAAASKGDYLFILDASGSMEASVENRMKMDIVKELMIEQVFSMSQRSSVGLAVYGHTKKADCEDVEEILPLSPLETSRHLIQQKIQRLTPMGMTPIELALKKSLAGLGEKKMPVTIIIIADGQDSCLGDPCQAVAEARQKGLVFMVNVIGFDVTRGAERQLKCIAANGGGRYYSAKTRDELREALRNGIQAGEKLAKTAIIQPESGSASGGDQQKFAPSVRLWEDDAFWEAEQAALAAKESAGKAPQARKGVFLMSLAEVAEKQEPPAGSEGDRNGLSGEDQVSSKEASGKPVQPTWMAVVKNGRVRQEPSFQGEVKGMLTQGVTVDVIGNQGEWRHIKLPDGRTGWAHRKLLQSVAPAAGNALNAIRVEQQDQHEEKVIFQLTGWHLPKSTIMESGDPKVICDFPDTRPGPGISPIIPVNGRLIKAIRTGIQKDASFRVVLDLAPDKEYELEHLYSGVTHNYTLIVKVVK